MKGKRVLFAVLMTLVLVLCWGAVVLMRWGYARGPVSAPHGEEVGIPIIASTVQRDVVEGVPDAPASEEVQPRTMFVPAPPSPLAVAYPLLRAHASPSRDGDRLYSQLRSSPHLFNGDPAGRGVVTMLEFLQLPYGGLDGVSLGQYNSLKNEVLDYLIALRPMPQGLGSLIVRMYNDRSLDMMWRDYCVQHFALYYEAKWSDGSPPQNNSESRMIRDAFWAAALETDSTITGSALIGMERLSRRYPEMDKDAVAGYALSLAMTDTSPHATRTTALQVSAAMGCREVLPIAKRLARVGKPTTVRMAAISALGELGSSAEIPLLQELFAAADTIYVRTAAKAALERIEARGN